MLTFYFGRKIYHTPTLYNDINNSSNFNFIWICLQYDALTDHSTFHFVKSWRRHGMETFSALLAICAGNSPASGEFPAQRPVMRSFDVFFDLCLNERLRKQSWGWWFETLSRPLWRHCNVSFQSFIVYVHQCFIILSMHTKMVNALDYS